MAKQWVYLDTKAREDLTDQLGEAPDRDTIRARLGVMGLAFFHWQRAGIPFPPYLFVATDASLAYLGTDAFPDGLDAQIEAGIRTLEARTGKTFGGMENPMILSVQSSPRRSMPGLRRGARYVGITSETCKALTALSGDPDFAYHMYAYIIIDVAGEAYGIDRVHFEPAWDGAGDDPTTWDWQAIASVCLDLYRVEVGEPFPQDPYRQLNLVLRAIFRAWEDPRTVQYREQEGFPHDWGVGASIMPLIFGNLGPDSGAGVVFSRHPVTGERTIYGGYVPCISSYETYELYDQLTPNELIPLNARHPELHARLVDLLYQAEAHERDAQHVEFVVEQGRLWVVMVHRAGRSARAAVRMARDMVAEGLISPQEARDRLCAHGTVTTVPPDMSPEAAQRARGAGRLLAKGAGVSPGAAVGAVAFDRETAKAYAEAGRAYILIRPSTVPGDVSQIMAAEGLIMQAARPFTNGATMCMSHNIPAVSYVPEMEIDATAGVARVGDRTIQAGDIITIDGLTGEIFLGPVSLIPSPVLDTIMDLWSEQADLS